jgi:hypothetical protein
MYGTQYEVYGYNVAAEQLALSHRAAKTAELMRAVAERRAERRTIRQHRRAARRGRDAYTTAV